MIIMWLASVVNAFKCPAAESHAAFLFGGNLWSL